MKPLILLFPILLSACASLHYERKAQDGSTVTADLTEFATDANLEGFAYKSDTASVEVASRGQNQTDSLKAIVEGIATATLKAAKP